jgi:shikimate kinase
MRFIDTDLLIQEQEGRLLKDIIREEGLDEFIAIENRVNAEVTAENSVIAPGGSAIYGEEAMEHFKEMAEIVYLKLSYRSIAKPLGDLTKRGVVFRPGQTLKALYKERCPLYEKYADYILECDGKKIGETLEAVRKKLGK